MSPAVMDNHYHSTQWKNTGYPIHMILQKIYIYISTHTCPEKSYEDAKSFLIISGYILQYMAT